MTPAARQRLRRAERLLEVLLLAALLVHTLPRLVASRRVAPPLLPMMVDLQSAPAEVLVYLPGIGPVKARAIVEDRMRRGPFPDLDALARVWGIGPKTIQGLRETRSVRVVVASPHEPPPPAPAVPPGVASPPRPGAGGRPR